LKLNKLEIVFFSPISWLELQKNGYRKTAGAMFQALWDCEDVQKIKMIEHTNKWGFRIERKNIDNKVEIIGLPIGLPFERFIWIMSINRMIQSWLLLKVLRHTNSTNRKIVYWFYDWINIELIQRLPSELTVMEITDSAEQYFSNSIDMLKRIPILKRQVIDNVDIIFLVNEGLLEEISDGKCHIEILPNGISKKFLEIASIPHIEPEELKGCTRPRICVVGTQWSLNYRVNHELLIDVLSELKDWNLVLVGCESIESTGLHRLVEMPQVRILNMVHQNKIISIIQHCDVCAVPYVRGPVKRDALKTYEYLACGKSVILTEDNVLPRLQPLIYKANDATDFAQACSEIISDNKNKYSMEARRILKEMTWDLRVERCLKIIQDNCFDAKN
jgi:glycosyltransferase involved in cell wall biosynthesis